MALRNAFENISTEAQQQAQLTALNAILAQLDDATTDTVLTVLKAVLTKLDSVGVTGTVALDAATLTALETVNVVITNPQTGLATETTLAGVLAAVDQVEPKLDLLATASQVTTLLERVGVNSTTPGLNSMIELLQRIDRNTDTLELTADSVALNADSINLNTDDVEALLTALSGNTGTALDPDTANTLIGRVKQLVTQATALNSKDFATQATLAQAKTALDNILLAVDGLEGFTDGIESKLDTLNAVDFATDAVVQAVRDRLPAVLDSNRLSVNDHYTNLETLAQQTGADSVRTFTFSAAQDLIWVRFDKDSAASSFGYAKVGVATPASGDGIPCEDGVPQPLTVRATTVKVWAPAGSLVSVWGYS